MKSKFTELDKAKNDWQWIQRIQDNELIEKEAGDICEYLIGKYWNDNLYISNPQTKYYTLRTITPAYIGTLLKRHKKGELKKPEDIKQPKPKPEYKLNLDGEELVNNQRNTVIDLIKDHIKKDKGYEIVIKEIQKK